MDVNCVHLSGTLATDPDLRVFESGARLARYLLTVRSEDPRRRVDVVPIALWDPPDAAVSCMRGDRLWVAGMVQRRFWAGEDGRRSRIEVVAHEVTPQEDEEPAALPD